MHILATAKMSGCANTLVSPIKELQKRGHQVTIYATGNENEVKAFQDLVTEKVIPPDREAYVQLVQKQKYDLVLTGMSGIDSPDSEFIIAAKKAGIRTIAVVDQNSKYPQRINEENLPDLLAVMYKSCKKTMEEQLGDFGREAAKRSVVVGWTAFDRYASLREEFTERKRYDFLHSLTPLGIVPAELLHVHFTQNIHPDTAYLKPFVEGKPDVRKQREEMFAYEIKLTKKVFAAASDLHLNLAVKPHPGEEFYQNFTQEITKRHGFVYLPAKSCNSQQLMLAAASVSSPKSTVLTEGCLLEKNIGGILPDIPEQELEAFPSVMLGAIPYTLHWGSIYDLMQMVSSQEESDKLVLAERRKKFSVDGKASQRLADLVEGLK
ncbi:hypothetical protein HYX13_03250 [Candidatus Woesearchaeota archaeon]|nr:hypothetical protein [Candidatus Woesearchaeota archaeon]